jgi:hypothetical protein
MHLGWLYAGRRTIEKGSGHCPWPRQRRRTCPRLWVLGSGSGLGLRQRGAGGSEWLWPPLDGDPGALFHVTSAAAGGEESRGGSGGGCLGLVVGSGSCRSGQGAANWAVEEQETCSVLF